MAHRTTVISNATRRCERCNQHRSLSGGLMLASGVKGRTRFICADCRADKEDTEWDRDAAWLRKQLGRRPTEDEETVFCELVQRLWSNGRSDDEAREEALQRLFEE